MAQARWFIARNKEKVGPFSPSQLHQIARFKLLQPADFVWLEGTGKWVEASSLPGLFPAAAAKKYWLAVAGQTRGPFVAEQIKAGLHAGQFTLDTLACSDDTRQWQPLRQLADFQGTKLDPVRLSPSRARLLTGTLDFEEASLHLAGKSGDVEAKLISTLMDMKRNYAHNPGLVRTLDETIETLRSKRSDDVPALKIPAPPAAVGS